MITVLGNAYLKKAEQLESYNETHKQILCLLLHENTYYQKNELLCFANYCEKKLDQAIKELEQINTIQTEGELIKLNDYEKIIETEEKMRKRK